MRGYYFSLTVIGLVLPYCFFVPWVLQHGLNLTLMVAELFSTKIGAFFGVDVLRSAAFSLHARTPASCARIECMV